MKTLGLFVLLLVATAKAETLYLPNVCESAQTLKLHNISRQTQMAWLQFIGPQGHEEVPLKLAAHEQLQIPDDQLPSNDFVVKTSSPTVLAVSSCSNGNFNWSFNWSSLNSPTRAWVLPGKTHLKFYLQNLNPKPQTIMLHFMDARRLSLGTKTIQIGPYLSTTVIKLPNPGVEVELRAEGRLSVSLWAGNDTGGAFQNERKLPPVKVPTKKTSAYFLLANQSATESFVVKIDQPEMVLRARDLIKNNSYKIMIADIEYGPSSENRSLVTGSKTPFSWRVSKVLNFNDFAEQGCDGSPQVVEDYILNWLGKPRICFWGFHLKKELTPSEVTYGKLIP